MRGKASVMKCPKCDRCIDLEEKDTSSGHDMRTYYCPECKERVERRQRNFALENPV